MRPKQQAAIIQAPTITFQKKGQTKDFVHGNESFKTQTKVKLFLNWLSTQQLFLNLQGIIANNLKTQ